MARVIDFACTWNDTVVTEHSTNPTGARIGSDGTWWYMSCIKIEVDQFTGPSGSVDITLRANPVQLERENTRTIFAAVSSRYDLDAYKNKHTGEVSESGQVVRDSWVFPAFPQDRAVEDTKVISVAAVTPGTWYIYLWGNAPTINIASISVTVRLAQKYTITYNANGGSGAPAAGTKYRGQSYSISTNLPTWDGHRFDSWNTAANGSGTKYTPGQTYTADASLTLYAIWKALYTITFDPNGGTGGPKSQTKLQGQALTLSSDIPTRTGFWFKEWNTARDGSGTAYMFGGSYAEDVSRTLYAIWRPSSYSYTESKGRGTRIQTIRRESPYAWATESNIQPGTKLYTGDLIEVYISAEDGYSLGQHTLNNREIAYGGQHRVSGNVAIAATATVISYGLSITAGNGASVTVNRTSSPIGQGKTGNLTASDRIYTGDVLRISAAAATGYNVSSLTVNGKAHTSGSSITVSGNVTVAAAADANAYRLTIQAGEGASITVRRTGGSTTGTLTDGASIYYGDTLAISAAAADKYRLTSLTVNGQPHQSGGSINVTGAVTVAAAAEKEKTERLIGIRHNGQWKLFRAMIRRGGSWVQYDEQHRRRQ